MGIFSTLSPAIKLTRDSRMATIATKEAALNREAAAGNRERAAKNLRLCDVSKRMLYPYLSVTTAMNGIVL